MQIEVMNNFVLHRYNDGLGMEFVCKKCEKPITFPGKNWVLLIETHGGSDGKMGFKRNVQILKVEEVLQFHMMECKVYQKIVLGYDIPW